MSACPNCGSETLQGAHFCMTCGTALASTCESCGSAMPPGAGFCSSCGTPLTAPDTESRSANRGKLASPPGPAAASSRDEIEERRRVTILFADLSGFTSIAERLDPETLKRLVDRCLERLAQEVAGHGGRVDKFIGDNVMAIFGAPVAHDDDPVRAVRAGLGMQSAMAELNADLRERHGVSFNLCVGINTGEVLAGRVGDSYTVIGDSVNVASRLQSAAEPGSVIVGEATRTAARETFEFGELAPLTLKGKSTPVPAWRAVAELSSSPTTLIRPHGTPLVGRATELADLERLLERVSRENQPHLVTVVGSAGLGKSRLLREFEASIAAGPPAEKNAAHVLRGQCPPYGPGVVYSALGEALRSDCRIADGDASDVAWTKLTERLRKLADQGGSADDDRSVGRQAALRSAALMGRLLGLEVPAYVQDTIPDHDGQRMRENFFAAARAWVQAVAREAPVVLAWEDIHWADEGMLDLIEHLAGWVRGPLLQVCLTRDELLERRPGWGRARRTATTVFLDPLDANETRSLLTSLLSDVDASLIAAVAQRAEGNPLFAEELAHGVGEGSATTGELPNTVESLLGARLDSLDGFERRLVSHAAVMGRSFDQAALGDFAGDEKAELPRAIESLLSKNIIVPDESRGAGGDGEFTFRHVLIRDVAYNRLPKAERARRHFQIGAFLEGHAGERAEEIVAVLAEHYGRAAALGHAIQIDADDLAPMQAKAVFFLEAAGDAAARFYSNEEALTDYEGAIAAAPTLGPGTVARLAEKRGDMLLRMGRAETAIEVWEQTLSYHQSLDDLLRVAECQRKIGSAFAHTGNRQEAVLRYQAGINLIKDGTPSRELVRLYEDAAWLYLQTGDNMLAIYAAEKALGLAERLNQPNVVSRAHGIFGRVFGRIGDTAKARENLEKAVELARVSDDHETVLALLALGNQLEDSEGGYRESGDVYADALELAERIGDIPAQIELHASLARLDFYAGRWDAVRRSSDASAFLSEREGLRGKLCLPYVLRGLLHWRAGDWESSERLFRSAHELAEQIGWSEVAFFALHGLGVTLRDSDRVDDAEAALVRALELCERAGLMSQSIQTRAALALLYAQSGSLARAKDIAEAAAAVAKRVHSPVAQAAALEAEGVSFDAAAGCETLIAAQNAWRQLERPLDAARCTLMLAERTVEIDPGAATAVFAAAAEEYERLGVSHLAERARRGSRAREDQPLRP